MRLAYACSWWRPSVTTWSGSSASLMNALAARPDIDLVRVDAQRNLATAAVLRSAGALRGYGIWKYGKINRRLTDSRVRRGVARARAHAVLAVADVETATDLPTFFYQDASLSVAASHRDVLIDHAAPLIKTPPGRLEELICEQRAAYQRATGVLTFSEWFADWLVRHDGVPRERVGVVGGGLHHLPARRRISERGCAGTRALFIGRDFHRKGGAEVVAAIERLRAEGAGDFTLTIVGPASWPLRTGVPPWVDFRGEVAAEQVRLIWAEHDIFAMPTWFEPYGLVFLEARAAAVPSLGREAFCMPELVPSTAGRLIPENGGVETIAQQLFAISQDAELFESVAAEADDVCARYSWANVAQRTIETVRAIGGNY